MAINYIVYQDIVLCLDKIIYIYTILIITEAINDDWNYRFKKSNYKCYKLIANKTVLYTSNRNTIVVFVIIYIVINLNTNIHVIDIFSLIGNKTNKFDAIVCIVNTMDTILYSIETLVVL